MAIIDQMMARHYFGSTNPLGRHVTFDGDDKPYEIVGVVGDAMYGDMRETPRTIYFHAFQNWRGWSQFALRTSTDPAAVAPEVRRTVRELLKTIAIVRVSTLEEQIDASMVPERLIAAVSGFFGVMGSVLAAIGLYGLLAFTVKRRINEIGVLMALGATRGAVVRMVLGDALGMAGAGLAMVCPSRFGVKAWPQLWSRTSR